MKEKYGVAPFSPGWYVVLASVIGLTITPSVFLMSSIGIVMIPLQQEFGWNRAEISFSVTTFTVVLALSLPVIGILIDRFGSRSVLLPSVVIYAILLGGIAFFVAEVWQLWLIYALIGSVAAGANYTAYMRAVSKWFDKRRGLAIGIVLSGAGLSYFYVPLLVEFMTVNFGWRSAYYALASCALIVVPVLYWFFYEPSEEATTRFPDDRDSSPPSGLRDTGFSRREAICSPLFWLLFMIFAVLSFSIFGIFPHLIPMLLDRGIASSSAASIAASIGIASMAARVLNGYLIDRIFAPRVAFFCFLLSAVGMGLLVSGTDSYVALLTVSILLGFSSGAEVDLLAYLTGRYFGLQNFGQIYGLLLVALPVGTSMGAWAFGLAYETFGSYFAILSVCTCLNICIALVSLKLPRFPKFDRSVHALT